MKPHHEPDSTNTCLTRDGRILLACHTVLRKPRAKRSDKKRNDCEGGEMIKKLTDLINKWMAWEKVKKVKPIPELHEEQIW